MSTAWKYRAGGSSESAARFWQTYRTPRQKSLPPLMKQAQAEAAKFRAALLLKLSPWMPKRASRLAREMSAKHGEVYERRVYEALDRLRREGLARRVPDGFLLVGGP